MTTPKLEAAVLVFIACEAVNVVVNILPGARAKSQQTRLSCYKKAGIFNIVLITTFALYMRA